AACAPPAPLLAAFAPPPPAVPEPAPAPPVIVCPASPHAAARTVPAPIASMMRPPRSSLAMEPPCVGRAASTHADPSLWGPFPASHANRRPALGDLRRAHPLRPPRCCRQD